MKSLAIIQLSLIFGLLSWLFCGKSKLSVTMATFNIRYGTAEDGENHWEQRKKILINCLESIQADILATQEGLPFQLQEIQAAFPRFDWFGLGRYHQIPVDRPYEKMAGEHCAIFYDSTKFIVDRHSTFWLSDMPDAPGSMTWGNGLPRIVTWGIFREKQTNRSFAVFNTHFHWGETFVANSIRLIQEKIEQIADNLPVILLGDFNMNITDAGYAQLTTLDENHRYFHDVWEKMQMSEENSGTYHGFSGNPGTRIDWILITPELVPLRIEKVTFQQDGHYPSDHFPVLAQLQIQ